MVLFLFIIMLLDHQGASSAAISTVALRSAGGALVCSSPSPLELAACCRQVPMREQSDRADARRPAKIADMTCTRSAYALFIACTPLPLQIVGVLHPRRHHRRGRRSRSAN